MTSSNVSRLHEYLQAVASMGPYETVADFYTADVTIQEFPNRIAPHGRVRRLSDARAAYEQGRQVLMSQTYRVQRILEAGNELAVELEWTGILAVPLMNLPAKSEMKAFVAMFLTFRDGKIAAQRSLPITDRVSRHQTTFVRDLIYKWLCRAHSFNCITLTSPRPGTASMHPLFGRTEAAPRNNWRSGSSGASSVSIATR